MTERTRKLEEVLVAREASDGDGVRLKRVFGGQDLARFDPFLMLDEFGSDAAADYIGGFPSHPHRGFETVTYMLDGVMEHRDHLNNVGRIGPGDVQWMKAGSGVIHSEMPQQEEGRMHGFQLWLNLPAAEKMTPAAYRDIRDEEIPRFSGEGWQARAIAGSLRVGVTSLKGLVQGLSTDPTYVDLSLDSGASVELGLPDDYTLMLYVFEGELRLPDAEVALKTGRLGRFSRRGGLTLSANSATRALVIAGKPIGEPIVHYGPFVMNSREEIEQALRDLQAGTLVD